MVRQAIRSGVPIVPVASVGGHDTVFVLSEGRWLVHGLEHISALRPLKEARLPAAKQLVIALAVELARTI